MILLDGDHAATDKSHVFKGMINNNVRCTLKTAAKLGVISAVTLLVKIDYNIEMKSMSYSLQNQS